MSTKQLQIGLIGAGKMGAYHANKYHQHSQTQLVAIVDRDIAKAKELAAQYGCKAYADIEAIERDLDAVSIATPATNHHASASYCLQRGWHCLIEKPICCNEHESESLLKLMQANRLVVQVGHSERLNPVIKLIQDLNIIPDFIACDRLSPFSQRALDTDVILDLMIHDIDLLLQLAQVDINSAEIIAKGIKALSDKVDLCTCTLKSPQTGLVAQLTASRVSLKAERSLRLFAPGIYLSADLQARTLELHCLQAKLAELDSKLSSKAIVAKWENAQGIYHSEMTLEKSDPLQEQIDAFINSISTNRETPIAAEAGQRALQLALRVQSQL